MFVRVVADPTRNIEEGEHYYTLLIYIVYIAYTLLICSLEQFVVSFRLDLLRCKL